MHTRALLLVAAGIASLATAVITPTAAPAPRARRGPKPIKLKLPPAKTLPAGTVKITLPEVQHEARPDARCHRRCRVDGARPVSDRPEERIR